MSSQHPADRHPQFVTVLVGALRDIEVDPHLCAQNHSLHRGPVGAKTVASALVFIDGERRIEALGPSPEEQAAQGLHVDRRERSQLPIGPTAPGSQGGGAIVGTTPDDLSPGCHPPEPHAAVDTREQIPRREVRVHRAGPSRRSSNEHRAQHEGAGPAQTATNRIKSNVLGRIHHRGTDGILEGEVGSAIRESGCSEAALSRDPSLHTELGNGWWHRDGRIVDSVEDHIPSNKGLIIPLTETESSPDRAGLQACTSAGIANHQIGVGTVRRIGGQVLIEHKRDDAVLGGDSEHEPKLAEPERSFLFGGIGGGAELGAIGEGSSVCGLDHGADPHDIRQDRTCNPGGLEAGLSDQPVRPLWSRQPAPVGIDVASPAALAGVERIGGLGVGGNREQKPRRHRRSVRIAAAALLTLASCAGTGELPTRISGQIVDEEGRPLGPGLVLIEEGKVHDGAYVGGTLIDGLGRFTAEVDKVGLYGLHLFRDDYQYLPAQVEVKKHQQILLTSMMIEWGTWMDLSGQPDWPPQPSDPTLIRMPTDHNQADNPELRSFSIEYGNGSLLNLTADVYDPDNDLSIMVLIYDPVTGAGWAMSPPGSPDSNGNYPNGLWESYLLLDEDHVPGESILYVVVSDMLCNDTPIETFVIP